MFWPSFVAGMVAGGIVTACLFVFGMAGAEKERRREAGQAKHARRGPLRGT